MLCRMATWCSSGLTYKILVWLCLAILLVCGCASSAATEPNEQQSPSLAISPGKLAAELRGIAKLEDVFKLTYDEMRDIYEIDLSPFARLICYFPGPGKDPGLLILGEALGEADTERAEQVLTDLLGRLRKQYPAGGRLQTARLAVYGNHLLLVASDENRAVAERLERALGISDFSNEPVFTNEKCRIGEGFFRRTRQKPQEYWMYSEDF